MLAVLDRCSSFSGRIAARWSCKFEGRIPAGESQECGKKMEIRELRCSRERGAEHNPEDKFSLGLRVLGVLKTTSLDKINR